MKEPLAKQPEGTGADELAAEVRRLTDELDAARIERDKYRAATETMGQALQQMDDLLQANSDSFGTERE